MNDKNQVSKFVEVALNLVASFKSVTERDMYLKKVAQKSNINEEILRRELNKKVSALRNSNLEQRAKIPANDAVRQNKLLGAETFVLACRLYKKDFSKDIASELFEDVFNARFNQYLIDNNPIVSQVLDDYDINASEQLKKIISYDFEKVKDEKLEYRDCLKQLELRKLYKKQTDSQIKMQSASENEKMIILNQLKETILEIQSKKTEE